MTAFDRLLERFDAASAGFGQRLALVGADQWRSATPCTDWDVRALVNHVARGNLNFAALAAGGAAADFARLREVDALGADPVAAYTTSVRACADAFAAPNALTRPVDYPLGRIGGAQALAVRTTDTVIHTWDLARAIGADEHLDDDLVVWVCDNLGEIYAGLPEMPTSEQTSHRFFAAAGNTPDGATRQEALLLLMGRRP